MNIANRNRLNDFSIVNIFEFFVRIILILIIAILLASMAYMVLKTGISLIEIFMSGGVEEVSKIVVINVLLILAILEIFRTTLSYYTEGRVKLTYVIDTVIVGVLAEVKGFWFREFDNHRLVVIIALLMALIVARILTIRYSPQREDD